MMMEEGSRRKMSHIPALLLSLCCCMWQAPVTEAYLSGASSGITQTVPVSVLEDVPLGTSVYQVETDQPARSFRIVSQKSYGVEVTKAVFEINSCSGEITSSQALDRETTAEYHITVGVQLAGTNSSSQQQTGQQSYLLTLHITVLDVNDNAPYCNANGSFSSSVPLNTAVGDQIQFRFDTLCIDADMPDTNHSKLEWELLDSNHKNTLFCIDQLSGGIVLCRALNSTLLGSMISLQVLVSDWGMPSLSTTVQLDVVITQANWHSPVFNTSMLHFTVHEDVMPGTVVGAVRAADADNGQQSQVMYSLQASDKFQLDTYSGALTVTGTLDYEHQFQHRLEVTATDSARVGARLSTIAEIVLDVLNVNEPPTLEYRPASIRIGEDSPEGTNLATLVCTDPEDDIANLTINVPTGVVSYNNTDSQLKLATAVDAETVHSLSVRVVCRDQGEPSLNDTLHITITVNDVNEHTPQFSTVNRYRFVVAENVSAGSALGKVHASDADRPPSNNITYALSSCSAGPVQCSVFQLSNCTGVLSIQDSLDYEKVSEYHLVVAAYDSGQPSRHSTVPVDIVLLDVNDNAPEFRKLHYEQTVMSSTSIGTSILFVSAHDEDAIDENNLRYALLQGISAFRINATTGLVTSAAAALNDTQYNIIAVCYDSASQSPGHMTQVNITINVVDTIQNLAAPNVRDTTITVRVAENTNLDSILYTIQASDKDPGAAGEILYELLNCSANCENVMELDPLTGELRLHGQLDYEDTPEYVLLIRIKDNGKAIGLQEKSTLLLLRLLIVDYTEAYFVEDLYSFNALEGSTNVGKLVGKVECMDRDANSTISSQYSIDRGSVAAVYPFNITPTGELYTTQELDYDNKTATRLYELTIICAVGSSSAQTVVVIHVEPVNEFRPCPDLQSSKRTKYLSLRTYNHMVFLVHENEQAGVQLARPIFTDADSPDTGDGQLTFELKPLVNMSTNPLGIDPVLGTIYLTQTIKWTWEGRILPYTLITKDQSGALYNTRINMLIIDTNNKIPKFNISSPVRVSIDESAAQVGDQLLAVECADDDYSLLKGGQVMIHLSTDNGAMHLFRLDSINWHPHSSAISILRLNRRVLNETVNHHNVTLVCGDLAEPYHTVQLNIAVDIIRHNHHAPVFQHPSYMASIRENASIGSSVLAVSASDMDRGSHDVIAYSIDNTTRMFHIDQHTGLVSVARPLDRERQAVYEFYVTAADGHGGNSSALVTVILEDVDDNKPSFKSPLYTASILSSADVGFIVLAMQDVDLDLPENAHTRYTLQSNQTLFSVNASINAIQVNSTALPQFNTTVSFGIQLADDHYPGLTDTAMISVQIVQQQAVKEHTQQFTSSVYTVNMNETVTIQRKPVPVISLSTVDDSAGSGSGGSEDTRTESDVHYLLVDPYRLFTINHTTGEVLLTGPLDYEQRTQYTLYVQMYSQSTVSPAQQWLALRTQSILYVNIIDVNDNYPVPEAHLYKVIVSWDDPVGKALTTVQCTDSDSGDNSRISYSVASQPSPPPIAVDGTSGVVTLATAMNQSLVPSIAIQMWCSDHGQPPKVAHFTFQLATRAVNHHTPQFSSAVLYITVQETTAVGQSVAPLNATTLLATDPDPGRSGLISYSVSGGTGTQHFDLKANGSLTVLRALDRETTAQYTLNIQAADAGTPPKSSTAVVIITISDANDNTPTCIQQAMVNIQELAPAGTTVATMSCSDDDASGNNRLHFALTAWPAQNLFTVGSSSGIVYLQEAPRQQERGRYALTVRVSDNGNRSTVQTFTVNIVGKPPVFMVSTGNHTMKSSAGIQYTAEVTTNLHTFSNGKAINTSLLSLHASDPGFPERTGNLYYRLVADANNFSSLFRLDGCSGSLGVSPHAFFDQFLVYNLTVTATIRGQPNLSTNVRVSVRIIAESPTTQPPTTQLATTIPTTIPPTTTIPTTLPPTTTTPTTITPTTTTPTTLPPTTTLPPITTTPTTFPPTTTTPTTLPPTTIIPTTLPPTTTLPPITTTPTTLPPTTTTPTTLPPITTTPTTLPPTTTTPTTLPPITTTPTTLPPTTTTPTTLPPTTTTPTTLPPTTTTPTTLPPTTPTPTTLPPTTTIPTTLPLTPTIPSTTASLTASPTSSPGITTIPTPPQPTTSILLTTPLPPVWMTTESTQTTIPLGSSSTKQHVQKTGPSSPVLPSADSATRLSTPSPTSTHPETILPLSTQQQTNEMPGTSMATSAAGQSRTRQSNPSLTGQQGSSSIAISTKQQHATSTHQVDRAATTQAVEITPTHDVAVNTEETPTHDVETTAKDTDGSITRHGDETEETHTISDDPTTQSEEDTDQTGRADAMSDENVTVWVISGGVPGAAILILVVVVIVLRQRQVCMYSKKSRAYSEQLHQERIRDGHGHERYSEALGLVKLTENNGEFAFTGPTSLKANMAAEEEEEDNVDDAFTSPSSVQVGEDMTYIALANAPSSQRNSHASTIIPNGSCSVLPEDLALPFKATSECSPYNTMLNSTHSQSAEAQTYAQRNNSRKHERPVTVSPASALYMDELSQTALPAKPRSRYSFSDDLLRYPRNRNSYVSEPITRQPRGRNSYAGSTTTPSLVMAPLSAVIMREYTSTLNSDQSASIHVNPEAVPESPPASPVHWHSPPRPSPNLSSSPASSSLSDLGQLDTDIDLARYLNQPTLQGEHVGHSLPGNVQLQFHSQADGQDPENTPSLNSDEFPEPPAMTEDDEHSDAAISSLSDSGSVSPIPPTTPARSTSVRFSDVEFIRISPILQRAAE